jgi:hypothetical protein
VHGSFGSVIENKKLLERNVVVGDTQRQQAQELVFIANLHLNEPDSQVVTIRKNLVKPANEVAVLNNPNISTTL